MLVRDGAILTEATIPTLSAKVVAGGANNQLAARADYARLHDRGILYAKVSLMIVFIFIDCCLEVSCHPVRLNCRAGRLCKGSE